VVTAAILIESAVLKFKKKKLFYAIFLRLSFQIPSF
jgi:hypothetical protein